MCSVQCLCEDVDTFAVLLEKTLGMGICDPLVFQFQVFLHHLLNIAIVQVLGCSGVMRLLTVIFSPRPLTFNRFVGKMRLPASLISSVASFKSGWKGIMTMNSYLSGFLVLRGFKPCPPASPDTVGF